MGGVFISWEELTAWSDDISSFTLAIAVVTLEPTAQFITLEQPHTYSMCYSKMAERLPYKDEMMPLHYLPTFHGTLNEFLNL